MADELTEKQIENELSLYQRLRKRFQKEQDKIQENNDRIENWLSPPPPLPEPGDVVFVPQVQQAQINTAAQLAPTCEGEWHAKALADTIAENQAKVQALEHILSIINVLNAQRDAKVIRCLAAAAHSIRVEPPQPKPDPYMNPGYAMAAQQSAMATLGGQYGR